MRHVRSYSLEFCDFILLRYNGFVLWSKGFIFFCSSHGILIFSKYSPSLLIESGSWKTIVGDLNLFESRGVSGRSENFKKNKYVFI